MPETSARAPRPLAHPGRIGRGTMALRITVGAVFALTLFAVPGAVAPQPAAAGSSCTGWTSKAKPPKTIRVLRTAKGRVETVGFRTYVAEVMASGEWPDHLRMATLEAGALATKQYAWYYTMKGHHRSGYVRGGHCYDVRDDTRDQLYRPERAKPTARQYKAIDKTWALTLRKNGRFFLTGYRAGTVKTCAADANGWKLYARSVNSCAKKGWSSRHILSKYLSPNMEFVWSDATGPVIKQPTISLHPGTSIASGAATVSWSPIAKASDPARYQLQRNVGGAWKAIELPQGTARQADVWLKLGDTNRFRVRAKDSKGHFGPWSYPSQRKAAIRGPVGRSLSIDGPVTADATPPKVKIDFKGRSAALVARVGPGMGQAKVYINGKRVAVIDLDRANANPRKLVWSRNWDKAERRTVAVKAVRDGKHVEFNGLLTLR